MRAMLLERICDLRRCRRPLAAADLPDPVPGDDEVLIRVSACGVCHTELDEIEGRTPPPRLPVVPGHQVVGRVIGRGPRVSGIEVGERVGVAWIHSACGRCPQCENGLENLCSGFVATGRDVHGGYAELMTVPAGFVHRIPEPFGDAQAAPLLCAGAIGYRSLRLANPFDGARIGLAGFGASAHLVLQVVRHRLPAAQVYVFARHPAEREFALSLGAAWAGGFEDPPPAALDRVIDTTPAWRPVLAALEYLKPGGRLVVNAIRKEAGDHRELLGLDYPRHLWMEKEIKSVANVTRDDVREFLQLAAAASIAPQVEEFELEEANRALLELKQRRIRGAKVLRVRP